MTTQISPIIKTRMMEQNVNVSELAAKSGMSISLLSRMLRNDDHNYTVKMLQRIAAALDLDLMIDLKDLSLVGTKYKYVVGGGSGGGTLTDSTWKLTSPFDFTDMKITVGKD